MSAYTDLLRAQLREALRDRRYAAAMVRASSAQAHADTLNMRAIAQDPYRDRETRESSIRMFRQGRDNWLALERMHRDAHERADREVRRLREMLRRPMWRCAG